MDSSGLKVVSWPDENGVLRRSLLPLTAPDEDGPMGIPMGLQLGSIYPEPFASQLEDALAKRGIQLASDLDKPGAKTILREEIQRILRYEVNRVIQYLKEMHDE